MKRSFICPDEAATVEAGAELAREALPGDVLGLVGSLGAGKTVLVRGFVRGLGGDESQVRSPTFTLMNVYDASLPVYHFDLYRLRDSVETDGIGFSEFARGDGITLVEWADRVPEVSSEITRWVRIVIASDESRLIDVEYPPTTSVRMPPTG
jgi:tRNA threonylcarbamoyladenosine biosynthesis protein TsaE